LRIRTVLLSVFALASIWVSGTTVADDPARAAAEIEKAVHLKPGLENGLKVYRQSRT
jgi:hypothetical protein